MMYFSAQTGGFYDPSLHGPLELDNPKCLIPKDAVEVSRERWIELLAGNSAGQIITADSAGYPMLSDVPPPTKEELISQERQWRDRQLLLSDAAVTRHRDELEEGSATTLTVQQYAQLQTYRRALRAWPESGEFPLQEHRPAAPGWLPKLAS